MAGTVGIVITAKDNYTTVLSKLSGVTKSFGGDVGTTQKRLGLLNDTKASLRVDVEKAKNNLSEARKAYKDLGDEASAAAMKAAQADFDNAKSNLQAVEKAARDTQKELMVLTDTAGRTENSLMGGGTNTAEQSGQGTLAKLGKSGVWNQFLGGAAALGTAYLGSMMTDSDAAMLGSTLSGAAAGAAAGMLAGPVGALVGGIVGAIGGALTGAAQKFENEDEYFKSVVNDTLDEYKEQLASSIQSGSEIAATREQNRLSFKTLLGGEKQADGFLSEMTDFAANTPFTYDQLTSVSKTLLAFGADAQDIKPMLTNIGDAGAALGWSADDQSNIATYMGRMQTVGKATMEYLNPIMERGINVYDALRENIEELKGASNADIQKLISKGELGGAQTTGAISQYMKDHYAGAMEEFAQTYSGRLSTLQDAEANRDAAMGEGYNEERKKGIEAQIAFLSDNTNKEAFAAQGAYQAQIENKKEEIEREALKHVMDSDEYKDAADKNDGATVNRLIAGAMAQAKADWMDSKEYQATMSEEEAILTQIRDTLVDSNWKAGFQLEQEKTKGQLAATNEESPGETPLPEWADIRLDEGYYAILTDRAREAGLTEEQIGSYSTIAGSEAEYERLVRRIQNGGDVDVLEWAKEFVTNYEAKNPQKPTEINVNMGESRINIERDESMKTDIITACMNSFYNALNGALETGA